MKRNETVSYTLIQLSVNNKLKKNTLLQKISSPDGTPLSSREMNSMLWSPSLMNKFWFYIHMFEFLFFNQKSLVVQVIDEYLTIEIILFSDFHFHLKLIYNFCFPISRA